MEIPATQPNPEYALTAHEIAMANNNTLHLLKEDWARMASNDPFAVYDPNIDREVPTSVKPNLADEYVSKVKQRVDEMYEQAYAANESPIGPTRYFTEQLRQKECANSLRGRAIKFLGSLVSR